MSISFIKSIFTIITKKIFQGDKNKKSNIKLINRKIINPVLAAKDFFSCGKYNFFLLKKKTRK